MGALAGPSIRESRSRLRPGLSPGLQAKPGPHITSVDIVESDEIPASALELVTQKRTELIEQLSEIEIAHLFLNDSLPSTKQLAAALGRATVSLKFSPIFLGSAVKNTAVKNTAVKPLFDDICAYLASLSERQVVAHDTAQPAGSPQVELVPASAVPLVALAFKLEDDRFRQSTICVGCIKVA